MKDHVLSYLAIMEKDVMQYWYVNVLVSLLQSKSKKCVRLKEAASGVGRGLGILTMAQRKPIRNNR